MPMIGDRPGRECQEFSSGWNTPMALTNALHERAAWQDDAACRGSDTSVFFPAAEADAEDAKKICASCPVADACLEHAISTRQPDGVWGGLTPTERHRLIRRRQKAARKARARNAA
jgi:WhiB family transcriptional regulator, redox-sensing transcriptional regulator